MGFSLNPSKDFAKCARKTVLPLKCRHPKNVRDMFIINRVHGSGIFETEKANGLTTYDRCYVFSDINYKNLDKEEKVNVLNNLIRLLNFMSADFKITLANEYKNMSLMINEILNDINRDAYPDISEGIKNWIKDKMTVSKISDTERVMYLTVTTRALTYDEARMYFMGLDAELERLFTTLKSIIIPLNGVQRLNSLRKFFYRDDDGTDIVINEDVNSDPLLDVIPVSVECYSDYLVFNGTGYVSVLFARSFSSTLNEERVIHSLADVPYPSFITIDYAPVSNEIFKNRLANASLNNDRLIAQEISDKRKNGQLMAGVSGQKEKNRSELKYYTDLSADSNESCILAGLLITVTADSEDELAERIAAIKQRGRNADVNLETYNYVQTKALMTCLPLGIRLVNKMRAFLTSSLVSLMPFYAADIIEPGGTFLGINRTTKNLVFVNRKRLKSPHGIIVGHTGSGKSFFIKETGVAQTLISTDDDIIMIDPQNEMENICRTFNGKFLDFTPQGTLHINPMEIPEALLTQNSDIIKRNRFIAGVTEWADSFCSSVMTNITYTKEHSVFIARAVQNLYDTAFSSKKTVSPTITDLAGQIKTFEESSQNEYDRETLHRMYNSLSDFTSGGTYDMFTGNSNISINDNRLIAFGLKNVSESMWEPVMLTIMFFLSTKMEYNLKQKRATHIIIDEAQIVAASRSSANMLLKAVITYRKFGGIVTLAMQNLTRALENPDLRDMFSNCDYKLFFDQGGVDAQMLADIHKLSAEEFNSLTEETPGYCVLVIRNRVVLLDCAMNKDNRLYDIFSTNFHESAQKTAENKRSSDK